MRRITIESLLASPLPEAHVQTEQFVSPSPDLSLANREPVLERLYSVIKAPNSGEINTEDNRTVSLIFRLDVCLEADHSLSRKGRRVLILPGILTHTYLK